jgi:hypothetical protein
MSYWDFPCGPASLETRASRHNHQRHQGRWLGDGGRRRLVGGTGGDRGARAGAGEKCAAEVGSPGGVVIERVDAAGVLAPDDVVGGVDGVVVVEIAGQPNSPARHDGSFAAERRDRLAVGVSPRQAIRSCASRSAARSIGYVIVRAS